jgi:hypothetical protein
MPGSLFIPASRCDLGRIGYRLFQPIFAQIAIVKRSIIGSGWFVPAGFLTPGDEGGLSSEIAADVYETIERYCLFAVE